MVLLLLDRHFQHAVVVRLGCLLLLRSGLVGVGSDGLRRDSGDSVVFTVWVEGPHPYFFFFDDDPVKGNAFEAGDLLRDDLREIVLSGCSQNPV